MLESTLNIKQFYKNKPSLLKPLYGVSNVQRH